MNRGAIRMTISYGKNKTELMEARHYEKPWVIYFVFNTSLRKNLGCLFNPDLSQGRIRHV
jgi:hypothetical protein